jgi:hypothetical protein
MLVSAMRCVALLETWTMKMSLLQLRLPLTDGNALLTQIATI